MRFLLFLTLLNGAILSSAASYAQKRAGQAETFITPVPTAPSSTALSPGHFSRNFPLVNMEDLQQTMTRAERIQQMRSLDDPEVNGHLRATKRKQMTGLALTAIGICISFIPKVEYTTTAYGYTQKSVSSGFLAQPISLLFLLPGLTLQIGSHNSEHRATERYNELVQERLYGH